MIVSLPDGLHFKLDQTNLTASLTTSPDVSGKIFIPRSITFENQKYLITKISKGWFPNPLYSIQSIDFPTNSALRTIERGALSCCDIKNFTIPASVDNLPDGWCKHLQQLYNIKVSPKNKLFIVTDNKLLLGKSTPNSKSFDVLHFVSRNAKKITLPSYVKYIKPYSCEDCIDLTTINISNDSELLSISKKAFKNCSLESLFIPKHFETFERGWCANLDELNEIIISPKNKKFIFLDQKMLLGKSKQNLISYDVLIFACRNIKSIIIPSFVRFISAYSFYGCMELEKIEFTEDSQLISIENEVFFGCSFEKIRIPVHVRDIEHYAFYGCNKLKEIEFDEDCEITCFESDLFFESPIEKLNIPKNVEKLEDGWNYSLGSLKEVSVSLENKVFANLNKKMVVKKLDPSVNIYDILCFANRDIEEVSIPSYIKGICFNAFCGCKKIKTVEFADDSQLIVIGSCSFYCSSIEKVSIPSKVNEIGSRAFAYCKNLTTVEFGENSELTMIYQGAFSDTSIRSITFPPHLLEIEKMCFNSCNNLQKVIFSEGSELQRIHSHAFSRTDIDGIIIPDSVQLLDDEVFENCFNLKSIEFLSENIFIGGKCFSGCHSLFAISFPNLIQLKIVSSALNTISNNAFFYIPSDAEVIKVTFFN